MSLLTYNFESEYLNINHQITVVLPDKKRGVDPTAFYRSGKKYKVLWLLHGTYGDNTDWIRKTNIEMYAAEKDLVVVCPSALNSNYSNWPEAMMGYNMYDYFVKELMPLIYGWFPVSDKREDNFIAGLSMGGRGTIKFAVNFPELFGAAAVLSAVPVDFNELRRVTPTRSWIRRIRAWYRRSTTPADSKPTKTPRKMYGRCSTDWLPPAAFPALCSPADTRTRSCTTSTASSSSTAKRSALTSTGSTCRDTGTSGGSGTWRSRRR